MQTYWKTLWWKTGNLQRRLVTKNLCQLFIAKLQQRQRTESYILLHNKFYCYFFARQKALLFAFFAFIALQPLFSFKILTTISDISLLINNGVFQGYIIHAATQVKQHTEWKNMEPRKSAEFNNFAPRSELIYCYVYILCYIIYCYRKLTQEIFESC